jgi:Trk K+ transport system NAD-binding subunit
VVRDLASDVTIIATVRRPDSVARIHRAGADFAKSIGQVAGQLLAFQLLGEESVQLESQLKLVKTQPGVLAGKPLLSSRIREKTGCQIVAVERAGEIVVEFSAEFELERDDCVYVSGTPDMIDRYYEAFDGTRPG